MPYWLDDVIVHVRKLVIALVLRIHVASFACLLLCYSLSTTFTPSQSLRWFSLVVWSVRAVLLVVDSDRIFSLLVYCSFFNSLHLSCVHLVWSQTISLSLLCRLRHNSDTVFGRLVHPVLLVLLCPLGVPTYVSVLCGDTSKM